MGKRILRLGIRVSAGAKHESVGGVWSGPDGEYLVVKVAAPAVEGKANDAVIKALANAVGVRRRDVSIVRGVRSRNKIVEIEPIHDGLSDTINRLKQSG